MTILSLIAISAGLESASAEDPNSEKPNILVIFIDDMGFADLSYFGKAIEAYEEQAAPKPAPACS